MPGAPAGSITYGQSEKAARLVCVSIVCQGRDSTIQHAFKLSRCFDLHRRQDVTVNVHCERDAAVSESFGDDLRVYVGLK